jgi:hypothetical protein
MRKELQHGRMRDSTHLNMGVARVTEPTQID